MINKLKNNINRIQKLAGLNESWEGGAGGVSGDISDGALDNERKAQDLMKLLLSKPKYSMNMDGLIDQLHAIDLWGDESLESILTKDYQRAFDNMGYDAYNDKSDADNASAFDSIMHWVKMEMENGNEFAGMVWDRFNKDKRQGEMKFEGKIKEAGLKPSASGQAYMDQMDNAHGQIYGGGEQKPPAKLMKAIELEKRLMKALASEFPKFIPGKIASVNKVAKFLKDQGFSERGAMNAALDFEDYVKANGDEMSESVTRMRKLAGVNEVTQQLKEGTSGVMAIKNDDGTLDAIRVNWDAYPSALGATLDQHWNDEGMIHQAINAGEASHIGDSMEDSEFYDGSKADRGIDPATIKQFSRDMGAAHAYIFDNGQWTHVDPYAKASASKMPSNTHESFSFVRGLRNTK